MHTQHKSDNGNGHRLEYLGAMLKHERNLALERVRELRRDQEQEALPEPADELDIARSLADIETHASVIERAQERLRAIDFAFNQLEQGRYGICAECGEDIPLERIKALPSAAYCLECQEKRDRQAHSNRLWIDEPFVRQWNLPEGMAPSTERSRNGALSMTIQESAVPSARQRSTKARALKM